MIPFVPCRHCGDHAERALGGRPVCKECYDELRFGSLPKLAPTRTTGVPSLTKDDAGPGWDNTVRALEEDR